MIRLIRAFLIVMAMFLITQCDTTDSGDENALENLVTNSTWYAASTENPEEVYYELDFGEEQAVNTAYNFPCGSGDPFVTDTISYEVIDEDNIILDTDTAEVLDYSEDKINLELTEDGDETVPATLKPSCDEL